MSPGMILGTALHSITSSKLRSALTLLGVIIGVTSVIALMSIGRGAQASITSRISSEGADLLFINTSFSADDPQALTMDDVVALDDRRSAPDIKAVAPSVTANGVTVSFDRLSVNTSAVGTTPGYLAMRGYDLASGRDISHADTAAKTEVAVLGSSLAESLFENIDPVGATVRLNGRFYLVVGVLESIGGFTQGDNQAYVPITIAEARLVNNAAPGATLNVNQIVVQARHADMVGPAAEQADVVLRLQHGLGAAGEPDFTISNNQGIAETLEDTTEVLVIFLGAVGGISLFVGGIGIMNIMLVSVTERTREIGIRRAVGARRSAVLLQFLAEATVLSIGGGLIGVGIGVLVTQMFSDVQFLNRTFDAQMSVDVAVLAMLVAAGIGLAAGIYPAARAASLDPIEALRHE